MFSPLCSMLHTLSHLIPTFKLNSHNNLERTVLLSAFYRCIHRSCKWISKLPKVTPEVVWLEFTPNHSGKFTMDQLQYYVKYWRSRTTPYYFLLDPRKCICGKMKFDFTLGSCEITYFPTLYHLSSNLLIRDKNSEILWCVGSHFFVFIIA